MYSAWAWGGEGVGDPRSSLSSSYVHLSQAVLCPFGVPEPALLTDASSSIHGRLGARDVGGRRHLASCCSLQASCVLPLCPPWGTGRVGEKRGDPAQPGRVSLKRLPGTECPVPPPLRPGDCLPASQAHALLLEPPALRHRLSRQMSPSTLLLLEPLTLLVPRSPCVTQPLFAGWVSSAPASQVRT